MGIISEEFGVSKDPETGKERAVKRFILSSQSGIKVKVLSFGATINSIEVPDNNGQLDHIILGFDSVEDYWKNKYIGSTIGRYANRINLGKFTLDNNEYQVSINNNANHLHGGTRGWDKCVWESYVDGDKLTFTHHSPCGDQGYPGEVFAQVTYQLKEDGSLNVDFQAISSKATPINMTNHAFFNLAGHAAGRKGLLEHEFQVFGDSYLPVSPDFIPTGVIQPVENTAYDLRSNVSVAEALSRAPGNIIDHNYCNTKKQRGTLELAARFRHPPSGRQLEVFTTEPGLQVYTGNNMPKEAGLMVGRGGVSYLHQGAFCSEPQNYPDAPNKNNFPSSILKPGDIYKHSFVYKFTTV